jgi:drug/metabolite transporter superfamily protein YnfA
MNINWYAFTKIVIISLVINSIWAICITYMPISYETKSIFAFGGIIVICCIVFILCVGKFNLYK